MGVGAILNVVLGEFIEPMTWGALFGFSLLAGAFLEWQQVGSLEGAYRRRRLAPIAACAFALYVLGRLVADNAELNAPTPSSALVLTFGACAIAASAIAATRLGRRVHKDADLDSRTRRPNKDARST